MQWKREAKSLILTKWKSPQQNVGKPKTNDGGTAYKIKKKISLSKGMRGPEILPTNIRKKK